MKSINEKVQTDYPKSDIPEEEMTRICYRVGFENGANYVLECIEESIKNAPAGYGLIYHIIEQLKK